MRDGVPEPREAATSNARVRITLAAQVLALGSVTALCVSWALVALRAPDWQSDRTSLPAAETRRMQCFGAWRACWTVRPVPAVPAKRDPAWPLPAARITDAYGWPGAFLQCEWTCDEPLKYWADHGPLELDLHWGIRLRAGRPASG